MVAKFTKVLYEFVVEKGCSLKEGLEIIASKLDRGMESKIEKTGKYLLNELLEGSPLSNSLKKCPYISFDDIYITFIYFAEKTGNLAKTLEFLNSRCERKKNAESKLIEAGIYPCIVVLLALGGSLYLYFSKLFNFGNEVFVYLFLFLVSCGVTFIWIKKTLGENKLYESFLAISFLLKADVSMYDAVSCGALIMGVTTKQGINFINAGEKLLLGMDLETAFSLGRKYSNAFYYADKGGGKADVFEKLANWIGEKDEKKRAICIALLEPLFIFLTGIFLIILVANVFMPYICNLSFI